MRMSLDQLQPYFGFSRLPFDRQIAPSALYRSASHQEARARIQFLISNGALGLITGEVGAGKTSPPAPPSPALTEAATRSSTWQIRRSVPAGSTARSSARSVASRTTTRPT